MKITNVLQNEKTDILVLKIGDDKYIGFNISFVKSVEDSGASFSDGIISGGLGKYVVSSGKNVGMGSGYVDVSDEYSELLEAEF